MRASPPLMRSGTLSGTASPGGAAWPPRARFTTTAHTPKTGARTGGRSLALLQRSTSRRTCFSAIWTTSPACSRRSYQPRASSPKTTNQCHLRHEYRPHPLPCPRCAPRPGVRADPEGGAARAGILHRANQQRPHAQSLPQRHAPLCRVVRGARPRRATPRTNIAGVIRSHPLCSPVIYA
jgi:hypothetical protein